MKKKIRSIDIEYGKEVLMHEAAAIKKMVRSIDDSFQKAVNLTFKCKGRIIVTGVGKAGIIGQKISATLASTGSPSYWIHASEAQHGDIGRIVSDDVVLALSNSGETEVKLLLPILKKIGAKVIAITGNAESTLAKYSDIVLNIGNIEEACPLRLAPSASTTAMLALGDALALTVLKKRNFSKEDYAFYHPGGELGRNLITVEMIMRKDEANPVAFENVSVRDILKVMTMTKGCPGAVNIVNKENKLIGFFTDGDLRRRLQKDVGFLDSPIKKIMTKSSKIKMIKKSHLALEAYKILRENKIDQLPVIDENHSPVGIVDVQDMLDVGY
ncbi:MAG: KpsF/GutQ family sugar-phosphate isomerase [Candidatus Anammoxibacter sp.]